jgi:hypothetical protein
MFSVLAAATIFATLAALSAKSGSAERDNSDHLRHW